MPEAPSLLPEAGRLDPEPVGVALSNGTSVNLLRLRTRQLFRLLKIITRGAGPGVLQMLNLEQLTEENAANFGMSLAAVVVMSIPEAENETLQFIASMVEPHGIIKVDRPLNKQEAEHNQRCWDQMNELLVNPPIEDTLNIIEAIFRAEAPELASLGKRIAQTLRMAGLTGQDKSEPPETPPGPQELAEMRGTPVSAAASPATRSAEPSPLSTTSSPPSTGGATSESGTSPSAGSARSQTPSPAGKSESNGNGQSSQSGRPAAPAPS